MVETSRALGVWDLERGEMKQIGETWAVKDVEVSKRAEFILLFFKQKKYIY